MNTPLTPTLSEPASGPVNESLIEYPCVFPIKVMGKQVDGFVPALTAIALDFDPQFDPASIEIRPSKAGNYVGVTLSITATSRVQLDAIYRTLTSHPMVKIVL